MRTVRLYAYYEIQPKLENLDKGTGCWHPMGLALGKGLAYKGDTTAVVGLGNPGIGPEAKPCVDIKLT